MTTQQVFRCPFEVKGEQEGTILDVDLGFYRSDRLEAIKQALSVFAESPQSPGIRFRLDPSLTYGCKTFFALRKALVPFQSEILGTELELRLDPFLPYQINHAPKEVTDAVHRKDPSRLALAYALVEAVVRSGMEVPRDLDSLINWVEEGIRAGQERGFKNPSLIVRGAYTPLKVTSAVLDLLSISPSGIDFLLDKLLYPSNPYANRSTISIVRCPFYPEAFGRYSEGVEIVLTRRADFNALSEKTVLQVRRLANAVHRKHGVKMSDPDEFQANMGLWVPKYRLR